MSIESVMPSNHLILCRPLLLPPSTFPSIGVFSNESVLCIRWPKYWSLSFSISPSNEYSGLISFRIAWFDLLAVHGTLKSLLQYHSWKDLRISRGKIRFLDSTAPPPNHTHMHKSHSGHSETVKISSLWCFYPNFKPRNRFCFFKWEREKHLCSSSELTWGWSWLEQKGLWVRSRVFESPLGRIWLCPSL